MAGKDNSTTIDGKKYNFLCDPDELMSNATSLSRVHQHRFNICEMTISIFLEKAWQLEEVLKERIVIIDGAMGTMIQVIEYLTWVIMRAIMICYVM